MTFTTSIIGITIAVAFFYLKLVFVQWRKARKAAKTTNLEIAKARKQGRNPKIPEKSAVASGFSIRVTNWSVVVVAMVTVLVGFTLSTVQLGLEQIIMDNSWILVAAGIVGLSFGIN
jgi:hypothetical protein